MGVAAPGRSSRGYTLVELLAVIVLMGIIASVFFSSSSLNDRQILDLAAREVASALRFARSEALRTNIAHGVRLSSADNRLRVFKLASPPTEDYTVYHPRDKQLFDIDLDNSYFGSGITAAADFRFGGSATPNEAVAFTKNGVPASPSDLMVMDSGSVTLSYRGTSLTVTVAAINGQVSIP